MDKLKYVKLENNDGTYSSSIPLAVDSDYVDVNGKTLTEELANKVSNSEFDINITNIQNEIKSLASGSPKGTYTTTAALVSANPETGVYVIEADGHAYSWTKGASTAIDLGVYQSTAIASEGVKTDNIDIQMIDKYTNLMWTSDHSNMTTPITRTYNDISNHFIYIQNSTSFAVTIPVGYYFLASKIRVTSKTTGGKIRFRQGARLNTTEVGVNTNYPYEDASFLDNELNVDKICYGFINNTSERPCRFFDTFVNNAQINPITFTLETKEVYLIPIDGEPTTAIRDDILERITKYSWQKCYPILNITDSDKNNILEEVKDDISDIQGDIEDINDTVEELENTIANLEDSEEYNVPSYFREEINNLINSFQPTEKSLSLIFQTDHHSNNLDNYSGPAIRTIKISNYLQKMLPIDINLFGGDYIANGASTTKSAAMAMMNTLKKYIKESGSILLRGNHDCNQLQQTASEIMTDLEIFNIIGKKYLTNNLKIVTNDAIPSAMYGYIDFPYQKIRVVFVNTSDGYDQGLKIGMGNVNKTQLQWLADNAFDLTGKLDYKIIVFGHYPIYDFNDETASVEQGRLSQLKQLLLKYKNGENADSGSGNYHWAHDFSNQGAKPLLAYICGHTHADQNILTTDGILQIATTNAGYYGKENDIGTADELAFDIITIDQANNKLLFKRVGKGSDRQFNI